MAERELLLLEHEGATHRHRLRVFMVRSGEHEEPYVEVAEPGKCECRRRIALSELVHLVSNLTDAELLTIPNRDRDSAGHAHD